MKTDDRKSYRQIIKVEKIDFCKELKTLKSKKWLESMLLLANGTLPGLVPKKCPIVGVSFFPPINMFAKNIFDNLRDIKL